MISVVNVSKSFNTQRVLDNVNLDVKAGEILAVLGESGAGKSVLLKHIMGLLKPDAGKVVINSVDITALSERELLPIRKSIGYLFQEGALYDFMNVFDNLAFPLREHTGLKEKDIAEKVRATLEIVDLEGVEKRFPSELSGGMKKRVGLARAIIMESKILLCDEPTSGLDPIRSRDISDLIKNISRRMNCTTIITTHDIPNAFRVADRLVIVRDGKIVAQGTHAELESSTDLFVHEFIQ